jgi:putative ABC transport system permease protein
VPDNIGLFNMGTALFLLLTTLAVIVLSGIYPALIVSGFKPILAIKNKITAASIGGIPLRRALVVAQFAIAQLLIIGTIVAVNQMNFVNEADLGFNKNAVLVYRAIPIVSAWVKWNRLNNRCCKILMLNR